MARSAPSVNPHHLIFTAGASGGHIFPAMATAKAFLQQNDGHTCTFFLGGGRFMEAVLKEGFEVVALPASAMTGKGLKGKIRGAIYLVKAFFKARKQLRLEKPAAVVAFGGFGAVATVLAAKSRGISVVAHEQNVIPGRANKLMFRCANAICTTFAKTQLSEKVTARTPVTHTGLPLQFTPPPRLPHTGKNLVILGGSMGATWLSETIPAAIACLPKALQQEISVKHQARQADVAQCKAAYAKTGVKNATVQPFFTGMPQLLAECDLLISRAGSGGIVEAAACQTPSLFIPHELADGHQVANAKAAQGNKQNSGNGAFMARMAELKTPRQLAKLLEKALSQTPPPAPSIRHYQKDAAEKILDTVNQINQESLSTK